MAAADRRVWLRYIQRILMIGWESANRRTVRSACSVSMTPCSRVYGGPRHHRAYTADLADAVLTTVACTAAIVANFNKPCAEHITFASNPGTVSILSPSPRRLSASVPLAPYLAVARLLRRARPTHADWVE